MSNTATTTFSVTKWVPDTYDQPVEGPDLARVSVTKSFEGDLSGTSKGEGLFCGMADPADGAGYMVSERFSGSLGQRAGTFVLQHVGIMSPGSPPRAFGHVVPGSGTGELAGLTGTIELGADHKLTLTYDGLSD